MKTLRAYSMVIVLVVIAVLFHLLTNGLIFTAMNLTNIILQNSYVVLLILGMLPVILTGNVDLSVGSVLAFVGAIAAILQVNYHCGVLVTLLVSLLVGILIGCWQGMWIAYFDIPAFLVTLSGELVFRGLTQVVLDGASIGPFSDTFRAIASSFIPDLFGGSGFHGGYRVTVVAAQDDRRFLLQAGLLFLRLQRPAGKTDITAAFLYGLDAGAGTGGIVGKCDTLVFIHKGFAQCIDDLLHRGRAISGNRAGQPGGLRIGLRIIVLSAAGQQQGGGTGDRHKNCNVLFHSRVSFLFFMFFISFSAFILLLLCKKQNAAFVKRKSNPP